MMASTAGALLLDGLILCSCLMVLLWIVQWIRTDASIVDAGWAAGLAFLGVYYSTHAQGELGRRIIIGVLSGLWGTRLALYLLINRVIGKHEDGRYQTLRRDWGSRAQPYFFIFFQAQALLDVLLSLSFLPGVMDL